MLKCRDEQMEMPRISSQVGRQVIGLASALHQLWFFFSQQQLVRFCVFSIITLQKRMMCYPPYVHFVKYDDAVSFYDAVSDTIRRRGGNRGIFTKEGVDTVAYFGGNHGSRV